VRRVPALLLAFAFVATPAAAHVSPRLRVAAPEDGARVSAGTVRVVVVGEGGDGAGLFTMTLDGTLVDTTGKVGGTFTTLSVPAGGQTVVKVHVAPGEHEIRLAQAADPDNSGAPQPPVQVRFTAVDEGGGAGMLVLVAVVVAVAAAAVVGVRRRAIAEAAAPPGDRPAGGPAAP
jgi:hypothetical protein